MDDDIKKNLLKTGTTTVGIVTNEGVVLAADKQGSYGGDHGVAYIAGEMEKIKAFNEDIIMTIAGTATFAYRTIKMMKAEIKLKELRERRKVTMEETANLFAHMALQSLQSGGVISFIMAGKEEDETKLFEIGADGILKKINTYKISGSGMAHVNAILDTEYKKDITLNDGIALAKKCIIGSSGRDPATGIGYEIWTITKDKIEKVEDKTWKLD